MIGWLSAHISSSNCHRVKRGPIPAPSAVLYTFIRINYRVLPSFLLRDRVPAPSSPIQPCVKRLPLFVQRRRQNETRCRETLNKTRGRLKRTDSLRRAGQNGFLGQGRRIARRAVTVQEPRATVDRFHCFGDRNSQTIVVSVVPSQAFFFLLLQSRISSKGTFPV